MCCFSGNFALQPDLLACFSSVTLLFGQSWCLKVSIPPMRMQVSRCRLCWASVYSTSNGWVPWLAAWSDLPHHHPTHKRSEICVHASCTNSILCLCVMLNCVLLKQKTMTLCVFTTFSEPGRLRATTMLLGSGVGVLPFTINPVTPTGSTNCDTGTVTLHCFTFKDSHWQKTHWHTFKFCVNAWEFILCCLCSFYLWFSPIFLTPIYTCKTTHSSI